MASARPARERPRERGGLQDERGGKRGGKGAGVVGTVHPGGGGVRVPPPQFPASNVGGRRVSFLSIQGLPKFHESREEGGLHMKRCFSLNSL